MGKSVVSIVKNPEPDVAVRESLRLLGGVKTFIDQGARVLIKPNLACPVPPDEHPQATHPDVVAALITAFKDAGAQKVIVGEQPAYGIRARDAFKMTGIEEATKKAGGELCYFDEAPRIVVKVPDGKYYDKLSLPKIIKEVDLIVNAPKMKTCAGTMVTLGMKNHFGFLNFIDRLKVHREPDLAYGLGDIVRTVRPGLTLIDGIIAMEGAGPHWGTPIKMDTIVASRDVVAADAVGAAVMGFDPLEPPTTQVGVKYGLGNADLSKIEIVGATIENVRRPFKRSITMVVNSNPNVEVYAGGVCGGCLFRIPDIPPNPDPEKKYAVIIGRRAPLRKNTDVDEVWCVGKCGIESAMASRKFLSGLRKENIRMVPGCPPIRWHWQYSVLKHLREKNWVREIAARSCARARKYHGRKASSGARDRRTAARHQVRALSRNPRGDPFSRQEQTENDRVNKKNETD